MSIKMCVNGGFMTLAGQKIYHNGSWVDIPNRAKLCLNSAWHRLGPAEPVTVSNSLVVNGSEFIISDGERYLNAAVYNHGVLHVSSGGVAEHVMVTSQNYLIVMSGGSATVEYNPWSYGTISSETGAAVSQLERDADIYHLDSQGSCTKYDGLIENITLNSRDEQIYVFSGGTANSISILNGGKLHICSGGSASDITISGVPNSTGSGGTAWYYARMSLLDGAAADRITVSSGGQLHVSSLASATSVMIESGGSADIYGIASGVTCFGGGVYTSGARVYDLVFSAPSGSGCRLVFHGGEIVRNTFLLGGTMGLSSGFPTFSNFVISSGVLFAGNQLTAFSGTINSLTICSGGSADIRATGNFSGIKVSSGGILKHFTLVNDVTISSGGTMLANGSASGVTVHPGGSLVISSGARLENLNSMYGAVVIRSSN